MTNYRYYIERPLPITCIANLIVYCVHIKMEESVVHKTPIGALKLVANNEGICAVKWLFGKHAVSQKEDNPDDKNISTQTTLAGMSTEPKEHLRVCQRWLDAYFDGSLLVARPAILKPPLVLPDKSTR